MIRHEKPLESLPPVSSDSLPTLPPRSKQVLRTISYFLAMNFILFTSGALAYVLVVNPLMGDFKLQAGLVAILVFASHFLCILVNWLFLRAIDDRF